MMTACSGLAWLQFIVVTISVINLWLSRNSWKQANMARDNYLKLGVELGMLIHENTEAEKKRRDIK